MILKIILKEKNIYKKPSHTNNSCEKPWILTIRMKNHYTNNFYKNHYTNNLYGKPLYKHNENKYFWGH